MAILTGLKKVPDKSFIGIINLMQISKKDRKSFFFIKKNKKNNFFLNSLIKEKIISFFFFDKEKKKNYVKTKVYNNNFFLKDISLVGKKSQKLNFNFKNVIKNTKQQQYLFQTNSGILSNSSIKKKRIGGRILVKLNV